METLVEPLGLAAGLEGMSEPRMRDGVMAPGSWELGLEWGAWDSWGVSWAESQLKRRALAPP